MVTADRQIQKILHRVAEPGTVHGIGNQIDGHLGISARPSAMEPASAPVDNRQAPTSLVTIQCGISYPPTKLFRRLPANGKTRRLVASQYG